MESTYIFDARFTVLSIVALLAFAAPEPSAAQTTRPAQERSPQTSDLKVPSTDGRLGRVRGTVSDQSAGVLPGVVVAATAVGGRQLGNTVTNASGEFTLDHIPAGDIELLFHLDGFDDSRASVTIQPSGDGGPGADVRVVHTLALLARTESVIVRAEALPVPPAPRPALARVPEHDQDAVCGPAKAESVVPSQGTIRSRRDEATQGLFAAGDELLIDGGRLTRLQVGQTFVVRRRYPTSLTTSRGVPVMGEHSSGLLQIVSVEEQTSTAVVVYACDEMMTGDYLAPFEPEPIRVPDPVGTPAFDMAARILFGDPGQQLGVTRRMMVIDRGARQGVQPGQRLTLFRRSRFGGAKPAVVGEAVVVAVRRESATVRVEQATDVIFFGADGDWAAPQRPPSIASR